MAETKQYLDYNGLVKFVELVQTTFPTKAITAEALDTVNQCLTELVENYNEHTHSLENIELNVSYSEGKLSINSSHNHTVQTISNDHLQTPPPALPEGLRPEGWTPTINYSKEYFTLHMLADGNMTLYVPSSYTTAPSYSVNGGEWTTFTSETTLSLKSDDKVRVKCATGAYQRGSSSKAMFNGTGEYEVYGNAMSLLYGDGFEGQTTLTTKNSFQALFYNQTTLKNAENLILPATTLASSCYYYMFNGCSSLTIAPELPATILTDYCYSSMFRDCTSLVKAPELPATTLASSCYSFMFNSCTSLTTVPELPATILVKNCYFSMFRDCTGLTTAPELPATTLAYSCYEDMFLHCRKLTKIPKTLPATKLEERCYYRTFYGCSSLTSTPELLATILAHNCYYYMFYGANVLPDCSNIDFISEKVIASGGLRGLFAGTKVTDSDLEKILPKNNKGKYYLPATTLAKSCYYEMFYGCSSLTTAPELPATTLVSSCYSDMFRNCTGLTSAPELPATTLVSNCYDCMFTGCTSLTTAPELPATTLADYCYRSMFSRCSKLNKITMLATDKSANSCLDNWVNSVASSGTFIKHPNMTSLPTGTSGIPDGWTVQDYQG